MLYKRIIILSILSALQMVKIHALENDCYYMSIGERTAAGHESHTVCHISPIIDSINPIYKLPTLNHTEEEKELFITYLNNVSLSEICSYEQDIAKIPGFPFKEKSLIFAFSDCGSFYYLIFNNDISDKVHYSFYKLTDGIVLLLAENFSNDFPAIEKFLKDGSLMNEKFINSESEDKYVPGRMIFCAVFNSGSFFNESYLPILSDSFPFDKDVMAEIFNVYVDEFRRVMK